MSPHRRDQALFNSRCELKHACAEQPLNEHELIEVLQTVQAVAGDENFKDRLLALICEFEEDVLRSPA